MHNKLKAHLLFGFFIIVAGWIYSLGLKGGFLFDDFSNLGDMPRYGDMSQWENAKKFILSGHSGPTGRPISLFSFWLTADAWPNHPNVFKLINIFIHLFCGFLLYWVIRLTMRTYGYEEKKAIWLAVITAGIWLLHPYFVSTTLYVVQRMTQLCMMFSLMGIISYLYAREFISVKPLSAYFAMMVIIGVFTILATYSKENGALLPLLILVIEYCNPSKINKPIWQSRAFCLWLPSLVLIYILGREINLSDNPWPNRNFNQIERLLSESRIIIEYLYHLFVPNIEGRGLFQDGYLVSTSLFEPITTFFSIVTIIILFSAALIFKRKYPLFSLAILFFFASHLMESTIVGLELYFEHRNYIAAIFLFLPLTALLYEFYYNDKYKKIALLTGVLFFLLLIFMLFQRVVLWSDNDKLQLYWGQKNPTSVRAQSLVASYYFKGGDSKHSYSTLENALEHNPDSGLLFFQKMLYKTLDKTATKQDFEQLKYIARKDKADPQIIFWLRDICINISRDAELVALYSKEMQDFLFWSNESSNYQMIHGYKGLSYFLIGMLATAQGDIQQGYDAYMQSLKNGYNVVQGLSMASDLGNHGAYDEALLILDELVVQLSQIDENTLDSPKSYYSQEIINLRKQLNIAKLN